MECAESPYNDHKCRDDSIIKRTSACLQEIYTARGFKGNLSNLDCDTLAITPQNKVDLWNEIKSTADYTTSLSWENGAYKDEMSNSITNKTFYIDNGTKYGNDIGKISQNKHSTINIANIMVLVGPILGVIIVIGLMCALYHCYCKYSKKNNRQQDRQDEESYPLQSLNFSTYPAELRSDTDNLTSIRACPSAELSSHKNEFHDDISAHNQSGDLIMHAIGPGSSFYPTDATSDHLSGTYSPMANLNLIIQAIGCGNSFS